MMLSPDLRNKLVQLRLSAMVKVLDLHLVDPKFLELTFEQQLTHIADAEISDRANRKIGRLLKQAGLRYPRASIDNIDYHSERGIQRRQVSTLFDNKWIQHRQNLIILGATGTGKSWLGCAFATHACRHHYSVLYFNTNTLFEALALAVADRTLPQLRRKLINTNLLIIDDFGLGSIDSHLASIFLDIIDLQAVNGSLLLTSQYPTSVWHSRFEDPTLGDAVLDRIVHKAHLIELQGESMRKRQGKNTN